MTTLTKRRFSTSQQDLKIPGHPIAFHYGFEPIPSPVVRRQDISLVREINNDSYKRSNKVFFNPEEKVALLREVRDIYGSDDDAPLFLYHEKDIETPSFETSINQKSSSRPSKSIRLDIIGTEKSVAEAILLQTALHILSDEGHKDVTVYINSLGDKESLNRFSKELTGYYKSQMNELPATCRNALKDDIFSLLSCVQHDKCSILKEDAPKSIAFLTESSRKHFKEVLEHLETFNVPYKIHNYLVGNKSFSSRTLFEIKRVSDNLYETPLACGMRYDYISKKMGFKKDMPSAGIEIILPKKTSIKTLARPKRPKVGFVHLGFEARLKSLSVLQMLHEAKIPVAHELTSDRIGPQLLKVERLSLPFMLIMGQKEAMEKTIIVRNSITREQETLPIDDIRRYLETVL
ncbi:MAG: hypothetical protein COV70_00375 [Parcubacteria group bacterium CG11_big_fil_rev_8_21_14_0_20_39_22]|nr:MAG: hypothetical protein COV70_00375 [Parcubacteria group bacterium CG11_big_fil_rev_8_21_14_0_20_39_22]